MGEPTKHRSTSTPFSTTLKAVFKILEYHQIRACLIGEVALNYYNVPTVIHDVEIAVPAKSVQDAAAALRNCGGLFEPYDYDPNDFTVHTEYKAGFPRLAATEWASPRITVIIFPASLYGLEPLESCIVRGRGMSSMDREFSNEILDSMPAQDVEALCFPLLKPFFIGLLRQYEDSANDMAMIGAEQLVDGMDLDEEWCRVNLAGEDEGVCSWARRLVKGKPSRIAYYQDNEVTCFIKDQKEAVKLRHIPGYQVAS